MRVSSLRLSKIVLVAVFLLGIQAVTAQHKYHLQSGHSHNDYNQEVPFFNAYNAGVGSIEADVFLKDGKLLVAHNERDTDPGKSLEKLYLRPIYDKFTANKGYIYADTTKHLQLLIDIKGNHQSVLPTLLKELANYSAAFHPASQKSNAVRIVISGDMPEPENFKNYPDFIFFDGRPSISYKPDQLPRVAMISDNIANYIAWDGQRILSEADLKSLKDVIKKTHLLDKPFRFWGTKDNVYTWEVLEKIEADWIGTDRPEKLREFFETTR